MDVSFSNLTFWSLMALSLRAVAVLQLSFIVAIQIKDLKIKTPLYGLKIIFFILVLLVLSLNFPIAWVNYERFLGKGVSTEITSIASFSTALMMFLISTMFQLAYHFRRKDES